MHLKHLYEKNADGELVLDDKGKAKHAGVRVLHAGPRQKFGTELVAKAVKEGWMTMGGGRITIKGAAGDVVYRIVRSPGWYCCHCGIELENGGKVAAAHVAAEHAGKDSPDPNNPAGYERLNAYDCEKE